jgi:short-subunit dehydrogenase
MAAPIEDVEDKDFRYLFDVNFFGAVHTVKKIVPYMKKAGGGRILLVGSMGGIAPIPFDPYYSASKAALDMFASALNTELNSKNIYITDILPGGTKTDFTYKRKVYKYEKGSDLEKAKNALEETEQDGMAAERVGEIIYKEALRKCPKVTVPAGCKNKIQYCLMKLLPKKLIVAVIRKMFLSK